MRTTLLLLLLVSYAVEPAQATETYLDAQAQGKRDAMHPDHRSWYLNELRPAFSRFFGPTLNDCASKVPNVQLQGFGLVFTVTPEGRVNRVFWKTENEFSACVDAKLKSTTFPRSPLPEFFFGLEASRGS